MFTRLRKVPFSIWFGLVGLFILVGVASASEDPEAEKNARIAEINKHMADNSEKYQSLAALAAGNRGTCELAKLQEKQMTQLNIENNAMRAELKLYQVPTQPR